MLIVFFCLLALTASTRLIELNVSRRHRRLLFERGAAPVADPGFLQMVALHVGILLSSVVEVLWFSRTAPVWLASLAALGVILASALRVWAIVSLGKHWNVRVVDSTSLGVVASGPYAWIRHPNYVAVFAELALLPVVGGAWVTAAVGTLLHASVLRRRIASEERMLHRDPKYRDTMAGKPRFIPRLFLQRGSVMPAKRP